MTLLCMSNQENPIKFLFFPCELKAKYYPFILFVIFTLLNGFKIDFQVICGVIYGVVYHYFLKNKLLFSDELGKKLENLFCFKGLRKFYGFISLTSPEKQVEVKSFPKSEKDTNISQGIESSFSKNIINSTNEIKITAESMYNNVDQSSADSRKSSEIHCNENISIGN